MSDLRTLVVSADDIGLSVGNTDTIFEAADHGALTSVSILANGPAFEYAMAGYLARKEQLGLRVHLNLTEGIPLSGAMNVPHLVDSQGNFKTIGRFAFSYFLASRKTRKVMRQEIREELDAQMRRVLNTGAVNDGLAVDGHQHVHMLPFVFAEILHLKASLPIVHIRIPREPFHLVAMFSHPPSHLIGHTILAGYGLVSLSRGARMQAAHAGIMVNEWFAGVRYSGNMTKQSVESALKTIVAEGGAGETEILFHPGQAHRDETLDWSGNTAWHYSLQRSHEREFLMSAAAADLFEAFRSGSLRAGHNLDKVLRYLVSGTLSAAFHLGSLYVLASVLGLWYLGANVIAFGVGLIVSFSLQKLWTFQDTSTGRVSHQALFYAFVQFASLLVNTAGLYLLVEWAHLWYLAAQFLMLVLVAVGNFFIFNSVIFRHHGRS